MDIHEGRRRPIELAKSRGTYIILALLLGFLGVHNFYAGRIGRGAIQLAITLTLGWVIVGFVINLIWNLIDVFTVKSDGHGDSFV